MIQNCKFQRNYLYFFMFVNATAQLCLYVFAVCWVNIIMTMAVDKNSVSEALLKSPVSIALIAYTFTVSWFVGGLSAFHLYLVITNQVFYSSFILIRINRYLKVLIFMQTTYENFRSRYERKKNPFNHGCARNLKETLFSKIPRSQVNFRAFVKPEVYMQYDSSRYFGYAFSLNYSKKSYDTESSFGSNRFDLERCETNGMDHSSKWGSAPDLHRLASNIVTENVSEDKEKKNEGV